MTEDAAAYAHLSVPGPRDPAPGDRPGPDGRQFPCLLEDRYGRTDRLRHLAMKLTDHDGQPFTLVATHDDSGEPIIALASHPGAVLGLLPRERAHVWDPDPTPTAERTPWDPAPGAQPAIVLTLTDLHRLASIARALLTSLHLTTAAAASGADA